MNPVEGPRGSRWAPFTFAPSSKPNLRARRSSAREIFRVTNAAPLVRCLDGGLTLLLRRQPVGVEFSLTGLLSAPLQDLGPMLDYHPSRSGLVDDAFFCLFELRNFALEFRNDRRPVSGTRPGWLGLLETPLFPLMIGIIILYLFVFRGKKQQDRKRQDMLNQLKRGDRVQTIGGILGTVIEARESEVVVKVDESSNTKMRFTRSAIHRVLDEDGKAEAAK